MPPAKPLALLHSRRWHFDKTDLNIDRTAVGNDKNLTVFTFFSFFSFIFKECFWQHLEGLIFLFFSCLL